MALYLSRTRVLMPVHTGTTSWFEAGMAKSLAARINDEQPSGY